MRIEKAKNASKNVSVELVQHIYGIIIPFIQRTLMIIYLGMEYTGLGGLFASILSVLNLAELGVGAAMVYSLYKPIAEDDDATIIKILNLYKKYYRIIGLVILAMGLLITPFLSFLIKADTCPKDLNIYVLFLMTLASTVLTYWMYAYKGSLFQAHQKNYIMTTINIATTIIFDAFQIVCIVVFKNYYLYLTCALLRAVVVNIVIAYKANKMYPKYKNPKGRLEKEEEKKITRNIKDIFLNKIGVVLSNSFDSIVISAFLGLTILAQYQNYLYIWTAIWWLAGTIFNATRAGIGNSLICEDKDKVFNDFKTFTMIIAWIIVIVISGFTNLFQPFIRMWVGEKNVLSNAIVLCLSAYFLMRFIEYFLSTYKEAAGIWHSDRFRPLVSGIFNLILNLILVQFIGLYGVVISTVLSFALIDIPWLSHNVFKRVFKDFSIKQYLANSLRFIISAIIAIASSVAVCRLVKLDGILEIVVKLIIAMLVSNSVMLILNFKTREFKHTVALVKKIVVKQR